MNRWINSAVVALGAIVAGCGTVTPKDVHVDGFAATAYDGSLS